MAKLLTPKAVCEKIALSRATLDRLAERRLAYNAEAVELWISERLEAA